MTAVDDEARRQIAALKEFLDLGADGPPGNFEIWEQRRQDFIKYVERLRDDIKKLHASASTDQIAEIRKRIKRLERGQF